MLFNSYVFIFAFLPCVLLLWWGFKDARIRLLALTLCSYFFYAWWDWRFLPLMIVATTVDYVAGVQIAESPTQGHKKKWLFWSLATNLGILAVFKYYDFAAGSWNQLARQFGFASALPFLGVPLPIGISFYTFNSMSYTIDLYRGVVKKARSFLHYSAFVAMFPHLIAGPIVRFSDVEEQLTNLKDRLSWSRAGTGISFFVIGLAKKILIADRLALPVNEFFSNPASGGALAAWSAVLCYTFQLYFDFSGYSDMAVGLAHLLGIQFPQNFNSPYKATSIVDFWRRWHISLSTWLRDYLFIPLGGSSGSLSQTAVNLGITMFLGGLWHGAHWTFVIWGLYHGCLLAGYRLFSLRGWTPDSAIVARFLTLGAVMVGWVFFRAETLLGAISILKTMVGGGGLGFNLLNERQLVTLLLAFALTQFAPNTFELRLQPSRKYAFALAALLILALMFVGRTSPFLYFQF